jgi:alkylation response protein AidB-like acyl-CoA dehydrogenase
VVKQQLAAARAAVEQCRLLVLAAAAALDKDAAASQAATASQAVATRQEGPSREGPGAASVGVRSGLKSARTVLLVALIKAAVPRACERAIDGCLQIFGGAGVSQDLVLAKAWVAARSLRLADGPDEVHDAVVARFELDAAAARRNHRSKL